MTSLTTRHVSFRLLKQASCKYNCRWLSQAHAVGPSQPPLIESTIGDHFASIVSRFGDRPAVVSRHQRTSLTYEALDARSNSLARGLQSIGVRKGDRVSVSLGNNIEFAILTYACFKIGAILNPLNPSFNTQQVVSALRHLESSHLVIGAETNLVRKPPRSNIEFLQSLASKSHDQSIESELVPSLRQIVLVDNSEGRSNIASMKTTLTPFDTLVSDGSSRALPSQNLQKHDVVNIQFTSGTTSAPKAACLTHRNILNNGFGIGERMKLTEDDVVCCPPPLFHCFGSILGYMATATHGASLVFPSEAFDPLSTLKAVQEYKATALYGVATMFLACLELLSNGTVDHVGFEQLRTGIAAGSSVPAELMRKLHKTLNLNELTICYGMTETSPVSLMTKTDDPLDKRINTVGSLMPHVQARILDTQTRTKTLGIGQRGELAVSGYSLMKEYWNDNVKTAEVMIPDSEDPNRTWILTGDEASMDEDGYVQITGRIKDLIIRGGENIHPLEIENCLLADDRVREISVVGLPDERYGEVVAAFVVKHVGVELTAKEVRDHVRTHLSGHLGEFTLFHLIRNEVPRGLQALTRIAVPKYVFWVEDYPKTASNKIQKFKLKELGKQLIRDGHGLE